MGFLSGIFKVALSPIKAVAEIVDDAKGDNGEDSQMASLMTMGLSSAVKGTAKAVKEASEDIFED